MRAQCNESFEIKLLLGVMAFIAIWVYIQYAFGNFSIVFSQEETVRNLQAVIVKLNNQLSTKCPVCPELRCIGDLSFPLFMIGLFFGFLAGTFMEKRLERFFRQVLNQAKDKKGKKIDMNK
jgi:hypothetical protein